MTAIGNTFSPSPKMGSALSGPIRARAQPSSGGARDSAASDSSTAAQAAAAKMGQEGTALRKKPSGELLNRAELALLSQLRKVDQSVRAHEMAHVAAAGGLAKGGTTFSYQRGPDGQNYAVGGEVQIDTGKESTPQATIQKMQIVRQAALAPADPSPQDQQVAAHATLQIASSMKELLISQTQANQPSAQSSRADQGEDGSSRAIIQGAGQQLTGREASRQSPRAYAAYRTPFPPSSPSPAHGIDLQA